METDLTGQLRDYLDWKGPSLDIVANEGSLQKEPKSKRGPLVALAVAGLILVLGILPAVLLSEDATGTANWCPVVMRTSWDDVRNPPVHCEGSIVGEWELVALEVRGEAIPIPSYGDQDWSWVGLAFRNDGSWSGQFCNMIDGFYKMSVRELQTGAMSTTFAACSGGEGVVERSVADVLRDTMISYTVTGDRLLLRAGEVNLELIAVPELND